MILQGTEVEQQQGRLSALLASGLASWRGEAIEEPSVLLNQVITYLAVLTKFICLFLILLIAASIWSPLKVKLLTRPYKLFES